MLLHKKRPVERKPNIGQLGSISNDLMPAQDLAQSDQLFGTHPLITPSVDSHFQRNRSTPQPTSFAFLASWQFNSLHLERREERQDNVSFRSTSFGSPVSRRSGLELDPITRGNFGLFHPGEGHKKSGRPPTWETAAVCSVQAILNIRIA